MAYEKRCLGAVSAPHISGYFITLYLFEPMAERKHCDDTVECVGGGVTVTLPTLNAPRLQERAVRFGEALSPASEVFPVGCERSILKVDESALINMENPCCKPKTKGATGGGGVRLLHVAPEER